MLAVHLAGDWYTQEAPNWSRIDEGLYLGGAMPEPPPETTAVLNLCETRDPYTTDSYRREPIDDADPAPGLDWLRSQVDFITTERAAGRTVFVHCRNGVSRSGMVVVACCMVEHHWSREQAMAFVGSRRPQLRPNLAFRRLLLEWERSLNQ